jgi:S-DNA-T family DNA segregation ATPase FtsK/SpoIIIE
VRRHEWADPAPLEVNRPRLPWWTMLPGRQLLVLAPVLAVVVVVRLVVWAVRRVYRYPLLTTALVTAAVQYQAHGWRGVTLLTGLVVPGVSW